MISYLVRHNSSMYDEGNNGDDEKAINTNLLLIYFGQFMETDGMRVTIISPKKI